MSRMKIRLRHGTRSARNQVVLPHRGVPCFAAADCSTQRSTSDNFRCSHGKRCRPRLHPGCSGLNWASLLTVGRFRFKSVGSDPIRAGRRRIICPGLVCPGLLRLPWAPSADLRRARAAAAPAGGQLPVAWWESGRGRFTKGSSPSALLRRPVRTHIV